MTNLSTILSKLALMRVSEHLEQLDRADRYLAEKDAEIRAVSDKYKRAVTDLAAEVEARQSAIAMNQRLTASMTSIEADRNHWREQALRDSPDAEAMRAKRKRDRDMKAAKRLAS